MENPLVSIMCITYNHAPYIEQALEGYLMQKTNFSFEILISDDASTDGTTEIIKKYEKLYPNLIKPIYHTENQYSKGPNVAITYYLPEAKGKYIAASEGDDFWTDPNKLQKQVDFMEAHKEYSLCFHNADVISEVEEERNMYSHLETRDYSGYEIFKKWTIPTCSVLFRNVLNFPIETFKDVCFGDIFLFLNLAEIGKLYCLNEKMGCYRRNDGGVSFEMTVNKAKKLIRQYEFMKIHFAHRPEYLEVCNESILIHYWFLIYNEEISIFEKLRYRVLLNKFIKVSFFSKNNLTYIYVNIIKKIIRL